VDDQIDQWLRYLQSRQEAAESNLRARSTITVPAAVGLLIGSYLFVNEGGSLALGLIGVLTALAVLLASAVYNLKCIVIAAGIDRISKRILLDQIRDSSAINDELNELVSRAKALSSAKEGLEVLRKK